MPKVRLKACDPGLGAEHLLALRRVAAVDRPRTALARHRIREIGVVGPGLLVLSAERGEEPEPVADEATAERGVGVVVVGQPVRLAQELPQRGVLAVVARERLGPVVGEPRPREGVAALLRDGVLDDAADLRLGRGAPGLVGQLGGGRVVHLPAHLELPVVDGAVRAHAVVHGLGVAGRRAVHGRPVLALGHAGVPHAGNQQGPRVEGPRRRQHVHHLPRRHELPPHLLHVDHRRLAGDGHRLLERADGQRGVHLHRRIADQNDPFADERVETRQREGDGVRARPQVDDREAAGTVGEGGDGALDVDRAVGLHRHAGQDSARRVFHEAGDGATLRSGSRRKQECACRDDCDPNAKSMHRSSLRRG